MGNIRYLENVYLSKDISQEQLRSLKLDLERHPLLANVFVIALAVNEYDQLDIYHSKYLMQRFYKKNPPLIIGIATKKGDAYGLVEKMVQECVTLRGDVNLKAYLVGE